VVREKITPSIVCTSTAACFPEPTKTQTQISAANDTDCRYVSFRLTEQKQTHHSQAAIGFLLFLFVVAVYTPENN
jgi:hypothetical protein